MGEETQIQDTTLRWIVAIISLILLGVGVVVGIQLAKPRTFNTFSNSVNDLINIKLLPVNSTITANAALTPSAWTQATPIVEVQRFVDPNWTTISTMVLNTSVARNSFIVYRKTGSYVELYYVLDIIQNTNASTTMALENIRVVLTLPDTVPVASTTLNQCLATSTNYTILGDTNKTTVIVPKKILALTHSFKSGSTTQCNKLFFDILFASYSLFNLQLSGSILYTTALT